MIKGDFSPQPLLQNLLHFPPRIPLFYCIQFDPIEVKRKYVCNSKDKASRTHNGGQKAVFRINEYY